MLLIFQPLTNVQGSSGLKLPVAASLRHFHLFALALLASGQTLPHWYLTGQIVMEGFSTWVLPQWVIRLFTRLFALLPVIVVAILLRDQEKTLDQLGLFTSIPLTALPFSIFPLIYYTSRNQLMGKHVNAKWNTFLGYANAVILTILNLKLIFDTLNRRQRHADLVSFWRRQMRTWNSSLLRVTPLPILVWSGLHVWMSHLAGAPLKLTRLEFLSPTLVILRQNQEFFFTSNENSCHLLTSTSFIRFFLWKLSVLECYPQNSLSC